MKIDIPKPGAKLSDKQIDFLEALALACRRDIVEMVANAQSGHPGGSLSSIDYLCLLYAYIISRGGEKIVVSNGHISPAVFAILAEMGYIPKDHVLKTFRKTGSIYEGHVARHVRGVWYGTGPLGIGVSVAAAFALAEKMKKGKEKVFAVMPSRPCPIAARVRRSRCCNWCPPAAAISRPRHSSTTACF